MLRDLPGNQIKMPAWNADFGLGPICIEMVVSFFDIKHKTGFPLLECCYLMEQTYGCYIKLKADDNLASPVCSESVESLLQM